jgi:hypothetical protein
MLTFTRNSQNKEKCNQTMVCHCKREGKRRLTDIISKSAESGLGLMGVTER